MDYTNIQNIIDLDECPLGNANFTELCQKKIDENGVLTLPKFLNEQVIKYLVEEGSAAQHKAFYSNSTHNVYLTKNNPDYDDEHVFNRQVVSSKGCITDDQISEISPLKTLYQSNIFRDFLAKVLNERQVVSSKGCITDDQISENSPLKTLYQSNIFRDFLAKVLNEQKLYEYEDPMSSINVHYASEGQELGWHFDNSSFAITLLLQAPEAGGSFEYIKDFRDSEAGEMNFEGVESLLDGIKKPEFLKVEPGTLVLFRGKNSIHRVTPTRGNKTRMLVVLAYNTKPGVSLSKSAQMTFFGRVA